MPYLMTVDGLRQTFETARRNYPAARVEEDVMDKKQDGPKTGVIVGLGLGMVICCVGLSLFAAGALGGLGAWLFDGGLTWLALALVLAAGGVYIWRRQRSGGIDANPALEARRDGPKPGLSDSE